MPEATKHRVKFTTPGSIAEAQNQRNLLLDEINDITTQLKDPVHRNDDTWRVKAIRALRAREGILRRINVWMSSNAQHTTAPQATVRAAHTLLVRLRDEDVEFDEAEISVIDDLGKYI